jgi:hypothetical protein
MFFAAKKKESTIESRGPMRAHGCPAVVPSITGAPNGSCCSATPPPQELPCFFQPLRRAHMLFYFVFCLQITVVHGLEGIARQCF